MLQLNCSEPHAESIKRELPNNCFAGVEACCHDILKVIDCVVAKTEIIIPHASEGRENLSC